MKIFNYFEYNNTLSAGGQPTEDQIQELKNKGFEAIVSLSPVSTKNYLPNEAELTEKLGIDFIHFPVDCSQLQPIHYTTFKGIMHGLNGKKIFVHCGGNIKTSNLIHMYKELELGVNESDSLNELKRIQNPEEKWFSYFKSFGMQGLN
ncbi:fused DSP-PTPase phosphatase/NAD kinase-like protein [Carboxylicivirga caseinilyticus]|uniref:fused DSP-PTPase phosphatase/NAD kinase-like protein n=1 Tax=Carboxylicivirga caseinilyticus TaxID=3417572 RepID=UPI003D335449|nr:hypothetical protein [Marinilabiliaceae bacterium A049]